MAQRAAASPRRPGLVWVAGAALVASLAGPAIGAAPAPAQAAAPDAAEDGAAFAPGRGEARGTGVRLGPSRSGFNFTTDFAVSLADFTNSVARGDSRGVDLGMILETGAEAVDEEGEYLPQSLRIDSRDEDADQGVRHNAAGAPADAPLAAAVGSQFVRATEDPFVEVETVMGELGLEEAIALEGGTSRATAGIVADGQREARGRASFERVVLGGGAVVLEGLEWEAVHRTGAEEAASATFRLGGIEIAEQSLLPAEASEQGAQGLVEGLDAANEVLAELGLHLEAPEETRDEKTGEIAITPLRLAVGPSEASRQVAGPLMDALQPVREPLADALIDAEETFGAVLLLFDVVTGAFAGGGELVVEIGGAAAVTAEPDEVANPFGEGFGQPLGSPPDAPDPELAEGGDDLASGGAPAGDGAGTPADAPDPETASSPPEDVEEPATAGSTGDTDPEPQAAAPAASVGARGGSALVVALLALLVAGGLGGVDVLRLRQAQRTIPG